VEFGLPEEQYDVIGIGEGLASAPRLCGSSVAGALEHAHPTVDRPIPWVLESRPWGRIGGCGPSGGKPTRSVLTERPSPARTRKCTLPPAVCGSVSAIGAETVGSMLCGSCSVDMIDPLLLFRSPAGTRRVAAPACRSPGDVSIRSADRPPGSLEGQPA
jgi:hypothetical protein